VSDSYFTRDPDDVSDFRWDWTARLADGETVQTATVTAPTGLTKDSQSNDTTTVTAWISGGTAGQSYTVTCRITTNQGRTFDWSIRLYTRER
jgi:hypothetical protein